MTLRERKKSTPFSALLVKLAKGLRKAKIPYMVFGGQAVMVYGEPRFTQDIDITLGVELSESERVLTAIDSLGLAPLIDDPVEFLKQTFVLPVVDADSTIRIDLVFSLSGFEREAIKRAKQITLNGIRVAFVSAEDLIILKMIAGRVRDLEDVRGVLAKTVKLQRPHIVRWLKAYDVELDGEFERKFLEIEKDVRRMKKAPRKSRRITRD